MKDSVSSQILQDIQTAWNILNPQHIIKHLDKCFIYDSQWVFESIDYERYISYLTGKFNKIRGTGCIVEATIVDGAVRLNKNGSIAFYHLLITFFFNVFHQMSEIVPDYRTLRTF